MKPDIFSRADKPPTCPLRWDHIDPKQRQWFCSHCQHQVHNLSAMTRREAERLLRSPCTGRRCISFLQDDCGRVVFRKAAPSFRSIGTLLSWFVSAVLVFLMPGCASAPKEQPPERSATASE